MLKNLIHSSVHQHVMGDLLTYVDTMLTKVLVFGIKNDNFAMKIYRKTILKTQT